MLLGWSSPAQDTRQSVRFCFVGADDLADASAPRFEQYMARSFPPFSPAQLDLRSNPIAKMYRTVIRDEMRHGPNFGGQYRVAVWGCGTSCAQFAVVNLRTGRVITVEGLYNVSGVNIGADDFLPGTDSQDWGFRFKKDSRLLVLVGAINEDESKQGAFYYVLKGERLELTHKTIATRKTCKKER
jgi:hypothetical protein